VIPNTFDLATGIDFTKGCFVGQEVVSKVENVGRPSRELVGLQAPGAFPAGADIFDADTAIGWVTATGQQTGGTDCLGLGIVVRDRVGAGATVTVDSETVTVSSLPFTEGSQLSGRRPQSGQVTSQTE